MRPWFSQSEILQSAELTRDTRPPARADVVDMRSPLLMQPFRELPLPVMQLMFPILPPPVVAKLLVLQPLLTQSSMTVPLFAAATMPEDLATEAVTDELLTQLRI